jgi:hypothetical protein
MTSTEAHRMRKSSGSYGRMEKASVGMKPNAWRIAPATTSEETSNPWRAESTTTTTARRRLSSICTISGDTGR